MLAILLMDVQWFVCRNLKYFNTGKTASIMSEMLVNVFSKINPFMLSL